MISSSATPAERTRALAYYYTVMGFAALSYWDLAALMRAPFEDDKECAWTLWEIELRTACEWPH